MGFRKKKTLLDQAEEYVGTAIDHAKEFVQDTALPALTDAKEKATPVVAAGAATVAAKAAEAKVQAQDYAQQAQTKAAELNGSKPKKRSKFKVLLLLGALGGVGAVVAKRLQGSGMSKDGGWQSSYDPAPPPSPASSVPPPAPVDTPVEEPLPTEATPEAEV